MPGFDKAGLSVLLLCHTPLDGLDHCPTAGVPVTVSVLRHAHTLDRDRRVPEDAAHHQLDLRKPMPARAARRLAARFDLVTTVCCDYDALVRPRGRGLVDSAWANVADMLRPGGFFVFSTARMGLESIARFLGGLEKPRC